MMLSRVSVSVILLFLLAKTTYTYQNKLISGQIHITQSIHRIVLSCFTLTDAQLTNVTLSQCFVAKVHNIDYI